MNSLQIVLQILGCVALFVYGMKILSEGVQNFSRLKVKFFTNHLTKTNFTSFLTGLGLTSFFQSSSAISVLVLSFVNAGLINLQRALGIIIGANIGTTFTLWLIAVGAFGFNIYSVALPLLIISVPMYFSKRFSSLGIALIGFSLIFFSLDTMKSSIPNEMQDQFIFSAVLNSQETSSYPILILAVLVMVFLTIIVQTSSAATAFVLTIYAEGYINLDVALAFVLGANIGTTTTAIIASFVGNIYTKFVAYFHLIFNLVGSVLFFFFLPKIAIVLPSVTKSFLQLPSLLGAESLLLRATEETSKAISLAIFHTSFNSITALLFFFFVPNIAKLFTKKAEKSGYKNSGILQSNRYINQEILVYEANKIVKKFLGNTVQTVDSLSKMLTESNKQLFEEVYQRILFLENQGDEIKKEVHEFFDSVDQKLSEKNYLRRKQILLEVTHHLESIGDLAIKIAEINLQRRKTNSYITPKLRNYLIEIQQNINFATTILIQNLDESPDQINTKMPKEIELEITKIYSKAESGLMKVINKQKLPPLSVIYYKEILLNYELIGDHLYDANRVMYMGTKDEK